MPLICYEDKDFRPDSRATIAQANRILHEYAAQGFDLTLRQLYYQFVARGFLANKDTEYKRLGSIVNDARLAGLIDWDHITDRTRNLRALRHWNDPGDMANWASRQFNLDLWKTQPYHVEVWIEKDALVGVIEGICQELDVGFFSCRGYTSQSEMWGASQRLGRKLKAGKKILILHLGDHDPSGIDMTRDIRDRLSLFIRSDSTIEYLESVEGDYPDKTWSELQDVEKVIEGVGERLREVRNSFTVDRIALMMEQVKEFNPPPNPAKLTDSRAADYVDRFGYESWELDALDPTTMAGLIRSGIEGVMDTQAFDASLEQEATYKRVLATVAERWEDVRAFLEIE